MFIVFLMNIKIRLSRLGRLKKPFYRVVVVNSSISRNGKFIENIGYMNPLNKKSSFRISYDRLKYWLCLGAELNCRILKVIKNVKDQKLYK